MDDIDEVVRIIEGLRPGAKAGQISALCRLLISSASDHDPLHAERLEEALIARGLLMSDVIDMVETEDDGHADGVKRFVPARRTLRKG